MYMVSIQNKFNYNYDCYNNINNSFLTIIVININKTYYYYLLIRLITIIVMVIG